VVADRRENLPFVKRAHAPAEKVRDYLLNPSHRTGGPKHAFFVAFGFERARWELLAESLCDHARQHGVAGQVKNKLGVLYVVEGPLSTPDGRNPWVRAVWFIDRGAERPRLATAYPLTPPPPRT
jgi:hypothetical protein